MPSTRRAEAEMACPIRLCANFDAVSNAVLFIGGGSSMSSSVPIALVAAWLGHADISFTLRTYVHAQPEALAVAVQKASGGPATSDRMGSDGDRYQTWYASRTTSCSSCSAPKPPGGSASCTNASGSTARGNTPKNCQMDHGNGNATRGWTSIQRMRHPSASSGAVNASATLTKIAALPMLPTDVSLLYHFSGRPALYRAGRTL
jgi:hypothetical protein